MSDRERAPISQATAALQRIAQHRAPDMHTAVSDEDSVAESDVGAAINNEFDLVLGELGWTREELAAELGRLASERRKIV